MRGAKTTLPHLLDGSMRARFKDRDLGFTTYGVTDLPAAVADEKTIDARLDAIIANLPKLAPATTGAAQSQLAQGC